MNRNQIANVVVLIAIVVMLVIAWYITPGGFWGGVLGIPFTILIIKSMEKYQDERFTQNLNAKWFRIPPYRVALDRGTVGSEFTNT